jgi:hypothetical protein
LINAADTVELVTFSCTLILRENSDVTTYASITIRPTPAAIFWPAKQQEEAVRRATPFKKIL